MAADGLLACCIIAGSHAERQHCWLPIAVGSHDMSAQAKESGESATAHMPIKDQERISYSYVLAMVMWALSTMLFRP
jgi:hypothetical protein